LDYPLYCFQFDGYRLLPNLSLSAETIALTINKGNTVMMSLAWSYLIAAGLFEIGWPVGLKMAQSPGKTVIGILLAGTCMIISGFLLFLAQRHIPMGTAYAVWTGIGAAGTFILGIFLYGDPVGLMRIFAVLLIISGVVLLKLAH